MYWFLFILMVIIETFGIYSIKNKNLFIGIICYILVAIFLYILFLNNKSTLVNHTWNIFSSIFVFIIGYLFLNEKLTNKEFIGATIGLIGLYLMNY